MTRAKNFFYKLGMGKAGRGIIAAFAMLLLLESIPVANGLSQPTNIIRSASDVTKLLCTALIWMFWGLIVLGIAMFLVGGYLYATAAGETEKVGRARQTLTYAAIAIAIAIIAGGIPFLIGSFLGVGSGQLNACGF